jgi:hypothetical protein
MTNFDEQNQNLEEHKEKNKKEQNKKPMPPNATLGYVYICLRLRVGVAGQLWSLLPLATALND